MSWLQEIKIMGVTVFSDPFLEMEEEEQKAATEAAKKVKGHNDIVLVFCLCRTRRELYLRRCRFFLGETKALHNCRGDAHTHWVLKLGDELSQPC
jgi:hypothetical protein